MSFFSNVGIRQEIADIEQGRMDAADNPLKVDLIVQIVTVFCNTSAPAPSHKFRILVPVHMFSSVFFRMLLTVNWF